MLDWNSYVTTSQPGSQVKKGRRKRETNTYW